MKVKPWRDAASVMLFARNSLAQSKTTKYDYQLLMMKRSNKSKFMPNIYVFPGGVSSPADIDKSWLQVFEKYASRDYKEIQIERQKRPFLMNTNPDDGISRDLAFRISAVRETFEESGVMLHHGNNRVSTKDFNSYRSKVHKDPKEFLKMCLDFQICPDVWNLFEFSDFLTPLGRFDAGNRRFDTIFYSHFLENNVMATLDDIEVTDLVWSDPQSLLDQFYEEKIILAPPQVYFLDFLKQNHSLDEVKQFSMKSDKIGVKTWMPVFYKCSNGIISLLPGDELYPKDPDYYGERSENLKTDKTVEEMNKEFSKMNRIAIYSQYNIKPFINF